MAIVIVHLFKGSVLIPITRGQTTDHEIGGRPCRSNIRQIHVKCNAFRQKKYSHLEKNPNEHDLGLYDNPTDDGSI